MRAGELNRQITIKKKAPGEDAAGQPNGGFSIEVCQVRARYRAPTGFGLISAERVEGGAEVSGHQCVWRIRWRIDITAAMRVEESIGGLTTRWDIKQVLHDRERREWVDLVCEAVR